MNEFNSIPTGRDEEGEATEVWGLAQSHAAELEFELIQTPRSIFDVHILTKVHGFQLELVSTQGTEGKNKSRALVTLQASSPFFLQSYCCLSTDRGTDR